MDPREPVEKAVVMGQYPKCAEFKMLPVARAIPSGRKQNGAE